MAKRTSPGIPSLPKPPKMALRRPKVAKPKPLLVNKLPVRPQQPRPARLEVARPAPPKPRRMEFPKPYTSDALSVIPYQPRKAAKATASPRQYRPVLPPASIAKEVPVKIPIKTVLWISGYAALLATTKLMLEAEGFDVHTASDFLQVEAACHADKFQLAIVDHTLAPKIKRAVAAVIREKRKGTYILELCQVSSEIPDADYLLIGHQPQALVQMVLRIKRERGG